MLQIVVCDDNSEYLNNICNFVEGIISDNCLNAKLVFKTGSPFEVQQFLKKNEANVFFMDIDLKASITGYDLAREIKESNPRLYIVFLTEQLQYVLQSFKVRPFDFLPKPASKNILEECLLAINKDFQDLTHQNEAQNLIVKFGSTIHYVPKNEIVYIETFSNKSIIHTIASNVTCYESLDSFEKRLYNEKTFVRCHKSFLANRAYFSEIRLNTLEIIFTTGHICYIGKKYKDRVISNG